MPTPALTLEKAKQAVEAVIGAYLDGYEISGMPSARMEAARRLGMSANTLNARLRSAQNYHGLWPPKKWPERKPLPSASRIEPQAPKPPPPGTAPWAPRIRRTDDLPQAIRTILMRGPSKLSELTVRTGAEMGAILDAVETLVGDGCNIQRRGDAYEIQKVHEAAYAKGENIKLVSRADNTFLFGACGDQHVGSKHYREDVASDLYERYERAGVQAVFNTGNWIDGEASFNRHDLVAHGIDEQARLLARVYPKAANIKTYAIWGADHEGWYANREGIDVGSYVEGVMRSEGRDDWHNLGFMEAHVDLVNVNSGKIAKLAVVHPGGGSAYALSYRPQKIIESYEGGEKPAVVLFGHYHKLDPGLVRSVWYFQTGCCQDQTVFMRQKSIEAHVGGGMLALEQDPETGAITGCSPTMWRYFNKGYYSNRWSKHGAVTQPERTIGGL